MIIQEVTIKFSMLVVLCEVQIARGTELIQLNYEF